MIDHVLNGLFVPVTKCMIYLRQLMCNLQGLQHLGWVQVTEISSRLTVQKTIILASLSSLRKVSLFASEENENVISIILINPNDSIKWRCGFVTLGNLSSKFLSYIDLTSSTFVNRHSLFVPDTNLLLWATKTNFRVFWYFSNISAETKSNHFHYWWDSNIYIDT